ncbi:uncharacterized protein LOC142341568 [Convolutriloba macropyga]|uniref:uncharacterized protein LOC142341568 n=1 Tax=Convolutriloba macropyga TaxID=536237 RepID=UPI003F51E542
MQFILIYSLKCVVVYVVLHALQCVIDATPDISNPPEPPNPPNPSDPPTPSTTPLPARQFLGYPIRTTSSPPVYSYTAPWRRSSRYHWDTATNCNPDSSSENIECFRRCQWHKRSFIDNRQIIVEGMCDYTGRCRCRTNYIHRLTA